MPNQEQSQNSTPRLFTVKQFAQRQQAFTEGALRAIRFNAKHDGNGFAAAFIAMGRRILIDEAKFFGCLAAAQLPKKKKRAR